MLYLPTYFTPRNTTIDLSQSQVFSAQINATKVTDYQIIIRKISDNSIVHNTTKIHLTTPLYNEDTLTHTLAANTITNNQQLKWTLTVWEDTNSLTSMEIPFNAYGNPTLSLTVPTEINSQSYDFTCTYIHPQSIGIKRFKAYLYDETALNIISETEYKYSANVHYVFDGFINNESYYVEFIAEDLNGVIITTGKKPFTISYSSPSLDIVPEVSLIEDQSAIKLKWANAVQYIGQTTGTFSYADNFIVEGNKGLQLNTNSTIKFELTIPEDSTTSFLLYLPSDFEGVFCRLGDVYEIGYLDNRFYYNNDGIINYGTPLVSATGNYFVVIRPTDIVIAEVNLQATWDSFDIEWDDIENLTFNDIINVQYIGQYD